MRARFSALAMIAFVSIFAGCTSCNKAQSKQKALNSLEGKTLRGTVTYGGGAFTGMEGYSFTTIFANGKFTTTSSNNVAESQGDFTYAPIDENSGQLTLTDRSALHAGEQITVTLTFTSNSAGTFDGRFLSGQAGEENGTFRLTP